MSRKIVLDENDRIRRLLFFIFLTSGCSKFDIIRTYKIYLGILFWGDFVPEPMTTVLYLKEVIGLLKPFEDSFLFLKGGIQFDSELHLPQCLFSQH